MENRKTIAVLFGGQSSEHIVSCMSAVNVAGQIWSARSAHDVVIPRETEVRVLKISGVKVLVEAI